MSRDRAPSGTEMIPLLYLLYYLLVKAVGKVVPVFGTRLSRRVHRHAADERTVWVDGSIRLRTTLAVRRNRIALGGRRTRSPAGA